MHDALALLELNSVALGLRIVDLMVKRAEIQILEANLVEPGKFVILYAGGVAETEESQHVALECADDSELGHFLIPHVHPELLLGLTGQSTRLSGDEYDCLGVVETQTISGALMSCDRALKDSAVGLAGIRLTGGLGGRAYFVTYGPQHDVEEAIRVSEKIASNYGGLYRTERIPRPHDDMVKWVLRPYPFTLQQ